MLLVALMLACSGAEKDSTPVGGGADVDEDGFVAQADGGDDCDDADADVNPDATEVCDEADRDENCDGLADDADPEVDASAGTETWVDADADSYGGGDAIRVCDPAPEAALRGGDCDDTNATVNPSAAERCDEANTDENCADGADNNDPSADPSTMVEVYTDGDGDSYGDASVGLRCDASVGQSAVGGDCDDTNPAVNPGAEEVCDAGEVDENCNDLENDGDPTLSEASAIQVWDDEDGDGYGGGAPFSACSEREGEATVGGDCDDTDPDLTPADTDGDGVSGCDGDCNDNNATVGPFDNDGDGLSGCEGDCDDADREVQTGCGPSLSYTSMVGVWGLPVYGCTFDAVGTAADGTVCPDCEFSFDVVNSLQSGKCIDGFETVMGYDAETASMTLTLYGTYELGPFDATLAVGTGYDILTFGSYSVNGYLYEGELWLY